MAGERILVVDDNPANLRLLRLVLSADSYDVRTAGGAEEALVILSGFRPQLILMDLQMPGMNGFELARRLKADPSTRGIVVVALTAYAMKGDEARAREAGCDGYVSKPIDTRTFPGIVAQHLAASEPSRAE
jgi:two-component system cell cycle response regulator DivK